ncbi:MAG: hypothetical protein IPK13_26640 [Deltaproteobacteria bacterium]|nr:hypothetical protein [Deltaproteobacteria bacterium]
MAAGSLVSVEGARIGRAWLARAEASDQPRTQWVLSDAAMSASARPRPVRASTARASAHPTSSTPTSSTPTSSTPTSSTPTSSTPTSALQTRSAEKAEKGWAKIERRTRNEVEGWCAAKLGETAVPQLPVVFEAATGWPAFGGRLTAVERQDVVEALRSTEPGGASSVDGTAFGWRYSLPRPGTYVFFCNDERIGEASLPAPEPWAAAIVSTR